MSYNPNPTDSTKLPLAGGTMAGNIAMGTNKITGLGTPTVSTDASTKAYADAISGSAVNTSLSNLTTTAINKDLTADGTVANFGFGGNWNIRTSNSAIFNEPSTGIIIKSGNKTIDGINSQTGAIELASGNQTSLINPAGYSGAVSVYSGTTAANLTPSGAVNIYSGSTAGNIATSGQISIYSGLVTAIGTTSGAIDIYSGNSTSVAGATGYVNIRSGSTVGPGYGNTGDMYFESGGTNVGKSGALFIRSGFSSINNVNGGTVFIGSGGTNGTNSNSGSVQLYTGPATAGNTGTLSLYTGDGTGTVTGTLSAFTGTGPATGNISLYTGNASSTTSGDISLQTGTVPGSLRGFINLNSKKIQITVDDSLDMGSKKITSLLNPTAAQDATTKSYVDGGAFNYTAQTSSYSSIVGDYVNCTSGTFTVTLPTAVSKSGKSIKIKNSGNGTITVATTSSQTVDGLASAVLKLTSPKDHIEVTSDGANWQITNSKLAISARYYGSVTTAIPDSGAYTIVGFDTAEHDRTGGQITSGTAWRYTAPRPVTCTIAMFAQLVYSATSAITSEFRVGFMVNGISFYQVDGRIMDTSINSFSDAGGSLTIVLDTNDYIQVAVWQNSGVSRNISVGSSLLHVSFKCE
jgi:hypothetical protein